MGTAIACSGVKTSNSRHTSTSWFSICGTGTSSVGKNGAPLNPFLRPDLAELVRPRASQFFLVQRGELGIPGHTRRLAPWSIVRGLGSGSRLSPWGGVVSRFCQSYCDAHPCILQICTESLRRNVRPHEVSVKKQPQSVHQPCLSLGLLRLLRLLRWWLWWLWWLWCGPVCNDACLSMTTHEMHGHDPRPCTCVQGP